MVKHLFNRTRRILNTVNTILIIIFVIFVIGHASRLIYEYLKYPEKSQIRWEKIDRKLNKNIEDSVTFKLNP